MSPTALTYERAPGVEIVPEDTLLPLKTAYFHGLGKTVENRFADLIRDGRDPAVILLGLASAIHVLDHNPQIAGVNEYEKGILGLINRASTEIVQADQLPEGRDRVRLLRAGIFMSQILGSRSGTDYRSDTREFTVPLINRVADEVMTDDELQKYLTPEDAEEIIAKSLGTDNRDTKINTLIELGLVSESLQVALGFSFDGNALSRWANGLSVADKSNRSEQEEGGLGTIDSGPDIKEILGVSFDASLDEVKTALEKHEYPQDPLVIRTFNGYLDRTILDPETSLVDARAYYAERLAYEDPEDQGRDYEARQNAALSVDTKILETAQDIATTKGAFAVVDFLAENHLNSDPDSEEYASLVAEIQEMVEQAISEEFSQINPGEITGEAKVDELTEPDVLAGSEVGLSTVQADQDETSAEASRLDEVDPVAAEIASRSEQVETERKEKILKKLEAVQIDTQKLARLEDGHPLKTILKGVDFSSPNTTQKAEILLGFLDRLKTTVDLLESQKLAEIHDIVLNDDELKAVVISIHDTRLFSATCKLFSEKRYRDVLVLLSKTRFLAPDNDEQVKAAKQIFLSAEQAFSQQLAQDIEQ